MAAFRFLAASSYALSLDIARYVFGKVPINPLAINTEIRAKSNDRFGLKLKKTYTDMKLKNISIVLTAVATALCACESREDVRVQQPDESEYIYEVRDGRLTAEAAMADLRSTLEAMGDHGRAEKMSAMEMPAIVTAADFRAARQSAGMMLAPQDGGTETADDTLLYVVNFGDGEGYAVMSTDASLGGDNLIALTESGSITIEDIVNPDTAERENPFLYMPGIRPMSDGEITIPGGGGGIGTGPGGTSPGGPTFYTPGKWENVEQTEIRTLPGCHQGSPYNNLCPRKGDTISPAGCGAIAALMLYSFHEDPSTIGGVTYSWKQIKAHEGVTAIIPQWVRTIGEECNTVYRKKYSYCMPGDITAAINNYSRYANAVKESKPDEEKVYSSLKAMKPIICGSVPNIAVTHGHYWLIDGYLKQRRKMTVLNNNGTTTSYYQYRELVHCSWGWGYGGNGYYQYRLFNPSKDRVIADSGAPQSDKDYTWGDWYFWCYFY